MPDIFIRATGNVNRRVSSIYVRDTNNTSRQVKEAYVRDTNNVSRLFYPSVASITARSPTSGSTAGGFVVTLTGTGFLFALNVRVNNTNVACTVVSNTQITFTMPATGAGTQTIYVVNRAGVSNGVTITTVVP